VGGAKLNAIEPERLEKRQERGSSRKSTRNSKSLDNNSVTLSLDPLLPKKERLEVDLEIGKREYFLRQSSSGLVLGPKSKDAYDRHVTFAFDVKTEELKHVHMKSGLRGILREDWRIIPARLMPDVAAWIRRNSNSAGPGTVLELDRSSYSFSVRRLMITYTVLEPAMTRIIWMVCRGLGVVRFFSLKKDGVTHVHGTIDLGQLTKQLHRLRPFRQFLLALSQAIVPKVLKRLAKLHLVSLTDMANGDVCIVFPKQGFEPMVIVKDEQHLLLSLERVYRHAMLWFSNLKVSEMVPNLSTAAEHPLPIHIRTKGVWE